MILNHITTLNDDDPLFLNKKQSRKVIDVFKRGTGETSGDN